MSISEPEGCPNPLWLTEETDANEYYDKLASFVACNNRRRKEVRDKVCSSAGTDQKTRNEVNARLKALRDAKKANAAELKRLQAADAKFAAQIAKLNLQKAEAERKRQELVAKDTQEDEDIKTQEALLETKGTGKYSKALCDLLNALVDDDAVYENRIVRYSKSGNPVYASLRAPRPT